MLNWIRKLITGIDRTEAASERAATAMEGIADLLEQARDALKQRLQGAPDQTPAPALPDQEPAPAVRAGGRGSTCYRSSPQPRVHARPGYARPDAPRPGYLPSAGRSRDIERPDVRTQAERGNQGERYSLRTFPMRGG
jgi:hypothetical protein